MTAVIEDDGAGFGAGDGRGDGLGLVGMRERVGLLGGRLASSPTEGAGTTIVAEVPLRDQEDTIRVLIVDDHAVVRSGLRLLLDAEDDIEVVGEAGDVRTARLRGAASRSPTSS